MDAVKTEAKSQSGVGLLLKRYPDESDFPHVAIVLEGGPAEKCGQITVGDLLIEVDGVPTQNMAIDDVKGKVVGEKGTSVLLRFRRKNTEYECKLERHEMKTLMEEMESYVDAFVRRQDVEHVRKVFDSRKDNARDGIPVAGLQRALEELHILVDDGRIEAKFSEMDTNSDGIIDFDEFRVEVQKLNKIERWTSSMPVHQLVAGALMPIVMRHPNQDALRAVAECNDEELILVSQGIMRGCLKLFRQHVATLQNAFKAADQRDQQPDSTGHPGSYPELASKFTASVQAMSCGKIDAFFDGLGERVGHPNLDFMKGMEQEHCEREGCDVTFTTSNYGITTTPKEEWHIVISHKTEHQKMGRIIPDYKELIKSPQALAASLQECEVIAIILYSGPMFQIYNGALRQSPKELPLLKSLKNFKMESMNCIPDVNLYPTTIHCLVSAITKISRITKLPKDLLLYRGLGGVRLPEEFYRGSKCGFNCFVEWGFMSTTSDKEVAIRYTGVSKGKAFPTLLMVRSAAVDHGADIRAFSQFPQEKEYLWNPLSLVEANGEEYIEVTNDGIVTILPVRMNMNVKTMTVDELKQSKKTMHINSFKYMLHQTQMQLAEHTDALVKKIDKERGQQQQQLCCYKRANNFLCSIMGQCKEVLSAHEGQVPEKYVDSMFYRKMVIEMLDINMFARSKVLVYILDKSSKLEVVKKESLRAGHRRYASFLERQFTQHKAGNVHKGGTVQAAALRLCKVKGLLSTDTSDEEELIDELKGVNELGEPRIVSAAAEGLSSDCLKLLVESKASINATDKDGITCVICAASVGNDRAIRTLVQELGADVNKANTDGTNAVMMAAREGHVNCIKMLASLGARLDHAAASGKTALIEAAENGHGDCIRELATLIKAKLNAEKPGEGIANGNEAQCSKTEDKEAGGGSADGRVATHVSFIDREDRDGMSALMHAAKCWHVDAIKQLNLFNATVDARALVIARLSGEGCTTSDEYYDCVKKLVELQWVPEKDEKVRVLINGDRRAELLLESKPLRNGVIIAARSESETTQFRVRYEDPKGDQEGSAAQGQKEGWFSSEVVAPAKGYSGPLEVNARVTVDLRQLRDGTLVRKDDSSCPFYVRYNDGQEKEQWGWFERADVFRCNKNGLEQNLAIGSRVTLEPTYRKKLLDHLTKEQSLRREELRRNADRARVEAAEAFKRDAISELAELTSLDKAAQQALSTMADEPKPDVRDGKITDAHQSQSGWTRLFYVEFDGGKHNGWYSSHELVLVKE